MKKTLIATAIAGAMSFSVAAQAAPTVYGNIQVVVDATDDMYAADNGSTIGFKGEEALNNGLTAIYKAEFEFDAGTNKGAPKGTGQKDGLEISDQNYLGVKGSFGTVRVGAFDTVSNDFVHDMVYAAEFADYVSSSFTAGENQQVQYTGEFGALTVGASVQLNEGTEAVEDKQQVMQLGAKFAVAEGIVASAAFDSEDGVGVGAQFSADALTLGGKFETSDAYKSVISASADFNYGMGNVYAVVDMSEEDKSGADSETNYMFGATYSLGSNMYTYVELGDGDTAESTAVGAVLSF
ncbi:porin [Oceanospirillum linum]|uniref:Porin domain-containing protein n=1 Tax=Oceanospirillum linum TaxID=966 RepID=A0A1T1HG02_OCELI|nr:porin [Oceanospirillum linum]OOV88768.1 hypothetical protein BTA35_0204635 [Oceanospirillum linum]SEG00456.1 Outer membrane protein (porin) [Oleiphilus messinensis]SMP22228.1 Outer membrane protein (porin) [Oceanospirillum linum]